MQQPTQATRGRIKALAVPICEQCGKITRLMGLESHPDNPANDLATYECGGCGHLQTGTIVR